MADMDVLNVGVLTPTGQQSGLVRDTGPDPGTDADGGAQRDYAHTLDASGAPGPRPRSEPFRPVDDVAGGRWAER
jgi:hypothetical protein